ncbi:MAG: FtsQ-type POTRA domain-containing protein [Pseudomonadota bacterium]
MVKSYRKRSRPHDDRKRRIILAALVTIVFLSAGLVCVAMKCYRRLCRSDFFRISSIEVVGCRHVSREEVLKLANIEIHSNLFDLNAEAAGRALEAHPWVKRVTVRKDLPDKLFIRIEEKRPLAVLEDNGLYYLDIDAEIMGKARPTEEIDYPVVTGFERHECLSESERTKELRQVLRFLGTKNKTDDILPAINVSEIHMDKNSGPVLYTVDGRFPIKLGKGNIEKKFRCLEKVLNDLYRKQIYQLVGVIDCASYSGRVLVRKYPANG